MGEVTEKLANFVTQVQFSDLPEDAIYETKRVLLDSIGCAIGGLSVGKGKIPVKLARRLGGPPESTIIGTGDRVSCVNAAFANGELINALEYEALAAAGHSIPTVIAASLALGESLGSSGKDLVLAIALGHEIANRIQATVRGLYDPISDGPDRGKIIWPSVFGYGSFAFAAAVAAGKIANLDPKEMANAIGIAGYVCPPNTTRKWTDTTPVRMAKYGILGWGAQAGLTSVLLAMEGYTGDTDVFQGEQCYWRYACAGEWNSQPLLKDLGRKWSCHRIAYKIYPAGR